MDKTDEFGWTIEDYKATVDMCQKHIQHLRARTTELCPHTEVIATAGGDSGDGDKWYGAVCTECGLSGHVEAGYGYGQAKRTPAYDKLMDGKVYVGPAKGRQGTVYRSKE